MCKVFRKDGTVEELSTRMWDRNIEAALAKAYVVAHQQGVGEPDTLDVRYSIMPRFDLLDENKADINVGEWKQPVNGNYGVGTGETDVVIYNGIKNQWNKIICLTGVRALQQQVYATSIKFEKGPQTIAIEDIQALVSSSPGESYGQKPFENPIIYDSKIALKISFRPKTSGVGFQDKLMFTGFVLEPQGTNIS